MNLTLSSNGTERWLAAILEGIDDAVIAIDPENEVRFINLAGEALTGWCKDTAIGVPFGAICNLVEERSRLVLHELADKAICDSRAVALPATTRLVGRNGKETPVEGSVAPIYDPRGAFLGTAVTLRDVSGRVRQQSEQHAHEVQKMDAASLGADAPAESTRIKLPKPRGAKYARDVPELKELLCDVPGEIMQRLDRGQSGLFEIAQGFQLSYLLQEFFPYTTSRNCTVAAGLDDLMVSPYYAGNVVLNYRTYPIRINSRKYVDQKTSAHLTMDDVIARTGDPFEFLSKEALDAAAIDLIEGNSGPGYPDQKEITWDEVTRDSGSPDRILEMTSVTKLPRRVFTFSRMNVEHSIRHNRTNGQVFLSLNFADYVDHSLRGHRVRRLSGDVENGNLDRWLRDNLGDHRRRLKFIGTGPKTDDMIQLG